MSVVITIFPDECLAGLEPLTRPDVRLHINDSIRVGLPCVLVPVTMAKGVKLLGDDVARDTSKFHRDGVSCLGILFISGAAEFPCVRELLDAGVFPKR